MNKNNLFALGLIFSILYFLPGLAISVLFIMVLIFQRNSLFIFKSLYNLELNKLEANYIRESWFAKKVLKFIFWGILIFNLLCFSIGNYQGKTEDSKQYFLPFCIVSIKALTFSIAGNDDGRALVVVNINGLGEVEKKEIETSFHYDLGANDDPVYIRYCFYNLDLFPDLVIDTNTDDYFISGLTGKIIKQEFIIDRIEF